MKREIARENTEVFLDLITGHLRQLDELIDQNARLVVYDLCVLIFHLNLIVLLRRLRKKRITAHIFRTGVLILVRLIRYFYGIHNSFLDVWRHRDLLDVRLLLVHKQLYSVQVLWVLKIQFERVIRVLVR